MGKKTRRKREMSLPPLVREVLALPPVAALLKPSWLQQILLALVLTENVTAWAGASDKSPPTTASRTIISYGKNCETCHTSGIPFAEEAPYTASPEAMIKITAKIKKPTTPEGVLENLRIIYENKLLRDERFYQPENLALFFGGNQSDWAWAGETTWLTQPQRAFAHCGTNVACIPSVDWLPEPGDTWTGGGQVDGARIQIDRIRRAGKGNYVSLRFEFNESGVDIYDAKDMFLPSLVGTIHLSEPKGHIHQYAKIYFSIDSRGWYFKTEPKIGVGSSSNGNVKTIHFVDIFK